MLLVLDADYVKSTLEHLYPALQFKSVWSVKSFIFQGANYLLILHVQLQFVFLAMPMSSNHTLSMLLSKSTHSTQ